MNDSVLFIIPTLYLRPSVASKTIETAIAFLRPQDKLLVIYNGSPGDSKFFYSNLSNHLKISNQVDFLENERSPFNISTAVNVGVRVAEINFDFFCFLHDDIHVYEPGWIEKYIEAYGRDPKTGSLGLRAHPLNHDYGQLPYQKVDWSDCIYMVKADRLKPFDESLWGDCETQDHARQLEADGYTNYRLLINAKHVNARFANKGDVRLEDLASQAREVYAKKWGVQCQTKR